LRALDEISVDGAISSSFRCEKIVARDVSHHSELLAAWRYAGTQERPELIEIIGTGDRQVGAMEPGFTSWPPRPGPWHSEQLTATIVAASREPGAEIRDGRVAVRFDEFRSSMELADARPTRPLVPNVATGISRPPFGNVRIAEMSAATSESVKN
jgi:hypothetical protein